MIKIFNLFFWKNKSVTPLESAITHLNVDPTVLREEYVIADLIVKKALKKLGNDMTREALIYFKFRSQFSDVDFSYHIKRLEQSLEENLEES